MTKLRNVSQEKLSSSTLDGQKSVQPISCNIFIFCLCVEKSTVKKLVTYDNLYSTTYTEA